MLEEDGNAKTKLRTHLGFSLPSEDQKDQEPHATYFSENVEETQKESSDSLFEDAIQRSLIVGDYKEAVAHCLSANKMADALVIAHVGGITLWQSTLDKYLKMSNAPYMKVHISLYSTLITWSLPSYTLINLVSGCFCNGEQ